MLRRIIQSEHFSALLSLLGVGCAIISTLFYYQIDATISVIAFSILVSGAATLLKLSSTKWSRLSVVLICSAIVLSGWLVYERLSAPLVYSIQTEVRVETTAFESGRPSSTIVIRNESPTPVSIDIRVKKGVAGVPQLNDIAPGQIQRIYLTSNEGEIEVTVLPKEPNPPVAPVHTTVMLLPQRTYTITVRANHV